jgi:phosphoribosylanthranilate isomerase
MKSQRMKIKICGLNRKEDIKQVIRFEPDFLGFIFYPGSPRFIREDCFQSGINLVPLKIKKVGVFVNAEMDYIKCVTEKYQLDFIQLHGIESPEFCYNAGNIRPVIKAFAVNDSFDFDICNRYNEVCRYFLFDTKSEKYGGSGISFNWELLNNYTGKVSYFLSGGISGSNFKSALRVNNVRQLGIDVNSGFELSPGVKNISELKKYVYDKNL